MLAVDTAHATSRSVSVVSIVNSDFEVSRPSRLYVEGGANTGTQQYTAMKEAAFDVERNHRECCFLAAMTRVTTSPAHFCVLRKFARLIANCSIEKTQLFAASK
jgi:hypothetical protein